MSERPREAEHVLGDVREDEVSRDRGDLVETRLAEFALYVILGIEAVAAEGLKGGVGRLPRGVGGQELRQVRLGAARLPPVEEGGCLLHHQRGGLDVRVLYHNLNSGGVACRSKRGGEDAFLRTSRWVTSTSIH